MVVVVVVVVGLVSFNLWKQSGVNVERFMEQVSVKPAVRNWQMVEEG